MRKIINFTGMDGSGKTTALQKIGTILRHRGFKVLQISGGHFDHLVYDFISLFEKETHSDQLLERFMHTLDLHMVIKQLKKEELADIDFLIFDRHFIDKRVFFELRTGTEWPDFFENIVIRDYHPEVNLYFKVDPRNAAWRLSRQRSVLDWKEKAEVLQRAPAVFQKYLQRDTAACVDIDANLSENLVLNQVMKILIGSKFD